MRNHKMGFGKDGKGVIITHNDEITLLTLADNTALKQDTILSMDENFRMIKAEIRGVMRGVQSSEGPIDLFLCNNELTVPQIEEATSASGPINRGDRQAAEQAERYVQLIGTFSGDLSTDELLGADGQRGVITKTIRWTFSAQNGWCLAAINRSGGALTTGGTIRLYQKFYGVWVM